MSKPDWVEFKSESKDYFISAYWEQRAETPDEITARFLRMIDALKAIHPAFSLWTCGVKRPEKFEEVRSRFAQEIAAKIVRDDWREPVPAYGYSFGARTRDTPKDRSFYVSCNAGAIVESAFANSVTLATDSAAGSRPDAEVVSFRIFRSALLALVDAWDSVHAGAYSQRLIRSYSGDSYFPPAWIQYLSPWLAQKITPPSTVFSEHLPNGGLLMTATTETFDVDNPAHLKAAQDMAAAMASLDLLTWPSQRA
ncbi:MAG: Imm52 family immunity protein [Roseiarcus sp.]